MFKPEHLARELKDIKFTVITVSSSRFRALVEHREMRDESGDLAVKILERHGFKFNTRYLIPDDAEKIKNSVLTAIRRDGSKVVVLIGGTGISKKDLTVEVISPLFSKRLYGFEYLFFLLSYVQVGADSITSRACGGVIEDSVVFSLPGSRKAVEMALEKIICPEIRHLLYHVTE